MYNNLKYAIVSERIIQYYDDSLKNEVSGSTPMVRFIDTFGCNCITPADNFIEGTLDELKAIINERDRIHKEKVKIAQDKFPQATDTEKKIIEYLIGDGYESDELTYEEIQEITRGVLRYCEFNSSLLDAYMDYMH